MSTASMPYRIETPRLVLRCYQPADAPLLKAAIDASLAHLRPWMPWARHEPTSLNAKIERLRLMRGNFDLDKDYTFGIFDPDERELIGSTGLHTRLEPGALEIGYWIHADHCGRGYAREAAAALTRVAFDCMHCHRVEIRCDPANAASLSVPRRLGYIHTETIKDQDPATSGGRSDTMVWTMSPAAAAGLAAPPLKIYDATGAVWGPASEISAGGL